MKDISKIDPKHNIIIKGAKLHNLKNVDVVIPRNNFTVITGLSGSGKSSLAYDTFMLRVREDMWKAYPLMQDSLWVN